MGNGGTPQNHNRNPIDLGRGVGDGEDLRARGREEEESRHNCPQYTCGIHDLPCENTGDDPSDYNNKNSSNNDEETSSSVHSERGGKPPAKGRAGSPLSAGAYASTRFSVEVSYLEIYNESLRDLFNPVTLAVGGGAGERTGGGGSAGIGVTNAGGLRLREDPRCVTPLRIPHH